MFFAKRFLINFDRAAPTVSIFEKIYPLIKTKNVASFHGLIFKIDVQ